MRLMIASTGTNIGKTFITCSICNEAKKIGASLHAIKPVMSGFEENHNDAKSIISSLGLEKKISIHSISPWIFKTPVAPCFASEIEKLKINYQEIIKFCSLEIAKHKNLLIESAGGIMSPITMNKLCIDLAKDLKVPLILVTGTYLGTLSHTLTAIKAIQFYDIRIQAIIVNQTSEEKTNETASFLRKHTNVEVYEQKIITPASWKIARIGAKILNRILD